MDWAKESNEVWEQFEPFRFSFLLCLQLLCTIVNRRIPGGDRVLEAGAEEGVPQVAQERLYRTMGTAQLLCMLLMEGARRH